MSGGAYHPSEGPGAEGATGESSSQPRNPLLCFLCDDYYSEPCLLACYHTFCSRCLRGRDADGKLTCPLCGYAELQVFAYYIIISFTDKLILLILIL